MTWLPIFEISSKDFEEDVSALKKIFGGFERQIHFKDGYKFSPEAQFAMGWWFYTVYVKIGFVKELVTYHHSLDSKVKDEHAILKMVQEQLKQQRSTMRVKFHGKKPIFARYWSWLMK